MALATYADLKTAVATWLQRSDLTANIPDFITLGGNRIAFGSKEPPFETDPLRVRQMETTVTGNISTSTLALPTRYLRARRFALTDGLAGPEIMSASPDYIWSQYTTQNRTGRPAFFAAEGENFVFGPAPDGTYPYSLLYYQQPAAFSAGSDTNSLLTANPLLYLAASLLEAFKYTRNNEQATTWHATFVGAVNAMQVSDSQDRYAGPWVARGDTGNP